jgi:cell division protein FtsX
MALVGLSLFAVIPAAAGTAPSKEIRATINSPKGCHVVIFLGPGEDAPATQIRSVRTRLQDNPRVRTFAFVSRKLALKRMAKEFPKVAKNLPFNPLPDSFEVIPRKRGDVERIKRDFAPGTPGVDHVLARYCS